MAIRLSRRIKLGVVAPAALSSVLLLIPAVAFATPQTPVPSVGTVQARLASLALRNTILIEQFDQAQVDVLAKQAAANAALKVAQTAQLALDGARTLLGATATAQYESGSFSTAGALLSSNSGQSYLDQLQTLQAMSSHTAQVIADVSQAKAVADQATGRANDLLKRAADKRDALVRLRAVVQKQVDEYTSLLGTMSVTQVTAYQQQVTPSVSPRSNTSIASLIASLKSSGAPAAAIKAGTFALEQVGKPYVYGAAGPDTYDCSGLTMASWAVAGVSLPHSSEEQFTMGQSVGLSQLQPGDLLFYYGPPPGHVTIYIGGGLMVSAPEPGENVLVAKLTDYSGSYVGARRVG